MTLPAQMLRWAQDVAKLHTHRELRTDREPVEWDRTFRKQYQA